MIYAFLFMKSILGHEPCAKNLLRDINNSYKSNIIGQGTKRPSKFGPKSQKPYRF
jgi:hypothetical protein